MIELSKLALRRGREVLFQDATLTIQRGMRVGVVGRNGSGKSSLLAALLGQLAADEGDIRMPQGLRTAHVAQHTPSGRRSALDVVLDGDRALRDLQARIAGAEASGDGRLLASLHAGYEDIDGYTAEARAARILGGLGFAEASLGEPVDAFSGGWRMRLNLAQALMAPSDLLLLDEPTNHLDLDAVLWLEGWLRDYRGTLLLISHDRDFLDAVADNVLHIEAARVRLYSGNFTAFEAQRAAALAQNRALHERQQRDIAHMRAFVDRFRAKATKARQAQSRLKALERMERIELAHVDRPFRFQMRTPARLPNPLVRLEDAAAGYDGRAVFSGARLTLAPGTRIGLVGHNGAGKSTLIKLLAGSIDTLAGAREVSRGLRCGYFAQHQLDLLDPRDSPMVHLRRLADETGSRDGEQALRDYLGGFGFPGEMADAACERFSGGERARLVLAGLVWQAPNLLLLDEPTNHLDLDMRDALASALQDFPGALVTVSHDRHLLRATIDELWLVDSARVQPFDGDLDDYRDWLLGGPPRTSTAPGAAPSPSAASAPADGQAGRDRRQQRQAEAEARRRRQPLKARAERLEAELEALLGEQAGIETALADATLYEEANREQLKALLLDQGRLRERIEAAEAAWLEASEAFESASDPAPPA